MSGTVDIRRVLLAVMAAAALVVCLAVLPNQAQAANDCAAAGTDPTAAQYCPPTEPQDECAEGTDTNGDGKLTGSECIEQKQSECAEGEDRNGDGVLTGSECVEPASTPPAPPAEGTIAEGGTLPFTGNDVLALLAVAAAFIAAGLGLSRLTRAGMEHS